MNKHKEILKQKIENYSRVLNDYNFLLEKGSKFDIEYNLYIRYDNSDREFDFYFYEDEFTEFAFDNNKLISKKISKEILNTLNNYCQTNKDDIEELKYYEEEIINDLKDYKIYYGNYHNRDYTLLYSFEELNIEKLKTLDNIECIVLIHKDDNSNIENKIKFLNDLFSGEIYCLDGSIKYFVDDKLIEEIDLVDFDSDISSAIYVESDLEKLKNYFLENVYNKDEEFKNAIKKLNYDDIVY